jgi:hypothetical protein
VRLDPLDRRAVVRGRRAEELEDARVLNALKEAGVNLLAFSGFPEGRRTQLDFFPADSAAFKQVAKKAKWKIVVLKRTRALVSIDGRLQGLCSRRGACGVPMRGRRYTSQPHA